MARLRFLAHAAGVVTVTAVLLAAVLTSPASACVCFPTNEAWRYQEATYVFSGVVVSQKVEDNEGVTDYYRHTVAVRTEYKGDVPRLVYVLSRMNHSCGLRLTVGTEYIVFAKGDVADRRLEIDQCSGTRKAEAGPPVTTSPGSGTTTPPTTTCSTAAP